MDLSSQVICEHMGAFILLAENRSLADSQVTFLVRRSAALSYEFAPPKLS